LKSIWRARPLEVKTQPDRAEELRPILKQLRKDFPPRDVLEEQTIQEIAHAFLDMEACSVLEQRESSRFQLNFRAIATIRRNRSAIERTWHKAIDRLLKLRTRRIAA
jgi:hypothetical protein